MAACCVAMRRLASSCRCSRSMICCICACRCWHCTRRGIRSIIGGGGGSAACAACSSSRIFSLSICSCLRRSVAFSRFSSCSLRAASTSGGGLGSLHRWQARRCLKLMLRQAGHLVGLRMRVRAGAPPGWARARARA